LPLANHIVTTRIFNSMDVLLNTLLPYILLSILIVCTMLALRHRTLAELTIQKSGLHNIDSENDTSHERLPAQQCLQLVQSICYIFIVVLFLGLPSLVLRLVHTARDISSSGYKVQEEEIMAQSTAQYLINITYVIKSVLLPCMWQPYRAVTWKIVRRLCGLPLSVFRCHASSRLSALTVVLHQNGGVALVTRTHDAGHTGTTSV
jgi:hypothetical protein